ncbi:hypothetical protein ACNQ2B_01305 [Mycoplasma sp. Z707]|uniref:hypothetical protein n=1 Tax=Mycoplasma sp. Z707 TaxID=3401691 RepID=UPI003AAF48FE
MVLKAKYKDKSLYKYNAAPSFNNALASSFIFTLIGIYWIYHFNPLYLLIFAFNPITIFYYFQSCIYLFKYIAYIRKCSNPIPNSPIVYKDLCYGIQMTIKSRISFSFQHSSQLSQIYSNLPKTDEQIKTEFDNFYAYIVSKTWTQQYRKYPWDIFNKASKSLLSSFLTRYQKKLSVQIKTIHFISNLFDALFKWSIISLIFGSIFGFVSIFSLPSIGTDEGFHSVKQIVFHTAMCFVNIFPTFIFLFLGVPLKEGLLKRMSYYTVIKTCSNLDNSMLVSILCCYDEEFIKKFISYSKRSRIRSWNNI